MTVPDTLALSPDRALAYSRLHTQGDGANLPGIVFLGGFGSDMTGTKAVWLEGWARERGRAFLRFDYRGHGQSSARFEEGCIGDWADDAYEAVTRLTEGPQILVGSSMGGWIALLLAKRIPERIAGLVGIAPAPDFTESLWAGLSDAQRAEVEAKGQTEVGSDYSEWPTPLTKRLFEDGRAQRVMTAPLTLPFPVRLLHGTKDVDVPWTVSTDLLEHITCADARLTLLKDGDHRLSGERELSVLGKTVHGITRAALGDDG